MDEDFDREFYRSRWQRVLPVGPDGIQPYVRAARGAGSTTPRSALRRLLAIFAALMSSVATLWRWDAIGAAMRPGRRYQ